MKQTNKIGKRIWHSLSEILTESECEEKVRWFLKGKSMNIEIYTG